MHYYQFNIGDYAKSTLHLSLVEDLAYRRLLDRYYDTEKPLDSDVNKLCRFIRMSDYKEETQQVLDEFFSLTQKGWIQKRVQKELGAYSAKADAARANGKKGGRPKKTQSVNSANPEITQKKAKQEPLNIKQEPLTNNHLKDKSPTAPVDTAEQDFEIYWAAGMAKSGKKKALSIFKKIAGKNGGSFAFANMLANDVRARLQSGQMGFDALHPSTYLNNERWLDEVRQAAPLSTGRQVVPDRSALIAEAGGDECPFYGVDAIDHQQPNLLEGDYY